MRLRPGRVDDVLDDAALSPLLLGSRKPLRELPTCAELLLGRFGEGECWIGIVAAGLNVGESIGRLSVVLEVRSLPVLQESEILLESGSLEPAGMVAVSGSRWIDADRDVLDDRGPAIVSLLDLVADGNAMSDTCARFTGDVEGRRRLFPWSDALLR